MYVDFGKERGRIKFTWKELTSIGVLLSGMTYGYIDLRIKYFECKTRVDQLEKMAFPVINAQKGVSLNEP